MTTALPTAPADTTAPLTASDESPACLVCGHDAAGHDATATRFCRATQAQALSRGCICR